MGKKDKTKKKISGSVKTALKTEKKLEVKRKKELAAIGEDDIEKVVAEIEREEARRQRVVEAVVSPPSRRVNFSLTAHPFKDELIMFGGEFHDGRQTHVYGDMFFYNLIKKEWTVLKAPGAPPPRCGHQTVATATNKGELWIFGGEFSSPSESQFYHYKDLWVYRIGEKKWEKVLSPGGPCSRSGHRMIHVKKQLFVFGGFHDNLRSYKYFNDLYIFNLETYVWHRIEPSGNLPAPRSGCILLPTPDNKILVYGGYSKDKVKKDQDQGLIHSDMFLLTPEKNDETGLKWKWVLVKQTGIKPSPRCSSSSTLVQSNLAYIFGGVFDLEDNEDLQGTFFNDLLALDLEKFQWHKVIVSGKKEAAERRRRRKQKDNNKDNLENSDSEEEDIPTITSTPQAVQQTIVDDGVFTVTVGPTVATNSLAEQEVAENIFVPSPRMNPGIVVKHNIFYLYGGMVEDGDRQYTLSDMYSLDCRKLNIWNTIISDDLSTQTWFESSSDDDDDEDDDDDDDDDDESNDEQMETN